MTHPAPLRIAYLVSRYPALSHTFIEREIAALRELGAQVTTFTVRPCPPQEATSATMRAELARTTTLIGASRMTWLRAHTRLLRRHPDVWTATLAAALRTGRLSPRARLWQVFYFAEAVLLWDLMDRRGLRHLHVHMANVAADVARLVVRIGRAVDGPDAGWRWTMTVHGPNEFENVAEWDVPAKLESASAISCISDFCRSQLMRLTPAAHWDKMSVVRMTVDPARFTPPPGGRDQADRPLRVLYVGRLVAQKGGPILVDALALLRDRGVAVEARIAGSGELEAPLREQIGELDLAGIVELIGPVGQDDILAQYHWADVFVLPSFQEGLPVVLMEAMATGLPVVTTRIAAVPELVVDHEMGRVVSAGRVDELAEAIAEEAADPLLRQRQGEAGRAAVQAQFTPSTAGPAMLEFLDESRGR